MAGKFTVVKEAILIPLMSRSIIKKFADFSPSAFITADSPGVCTAERFRHGSAADLF
jgi:hypothetical protein